MIDMIQIYPDTDLIATLLRAVGADIYYYLYSNNTAPNDSSVLASFAVSGLAFGGGVVDTPVPVASFTLQSVVGHVGKITAPDIVFTNATAGAVSVYGYLCSMGTLSPGPTDLFFAAAFDVTPIVIPAGGTLNVTPTLSLRSSS